jgi:hypothetical protein
MEPVQSSKRHKSRVLDALEAERESAGAFTGATGSLLEALEAVRERAGAAVGAASTSFFPLAGAAFLGAGLSFLIALVALGSAFFFVSALAFAISDKFVFFKSFIIYRITSLFISSDFYQFFCSE